VAFVGSYGVGKSTVAIVILFYFLLELTKVAQGDNACKLKRVFLRVNKTLYRFQHMGGLSGAVRSRE
jgi:hypothetical protein